MLGTDADFRAFLLCLHPTTSNNASYSIPAVSTPKKRGRLRDVVQKVSTSGFGIRSKGPSFKNTAFFLREQRKPASIATYTRTTSLGETLEQHEQMLTRLLYLRESAKKRTRPESSQVKTHCGFIAADGIEKQVFAQRFRPQIMLEELHNHLCSPQSGAAPNNC